MVFVDMLEDGGNYFSISTPGGRKVGVSGALRTPNFRSDKNKCVFNIHTSRFVSFFSGQHPKTSATPHLTVFLFLCSFRGNARGKFESS